MEKEAEIRNKLQSIKTILEFLENKKDTPAHMVNRALKDLKDIESILDC